MKSKLTYYLVAFSFVAMVGILNLHTATNRTTDISSEASLFTAVKNFFFPPEWSPEDCPADDGVFGLVYNGGFEFGLPNNIEFSFSENSAYNIDSETICGWTRNFPGVNQTWNYGARYFSFGENPLAPYFLHLDVFGLSNDSDDQRFVGLSVSEHQYVFQSHDYIRQTIPNLVEGETYELNFDFSVELNTSWGWPPQVGGVPNLGIAALLLTDEQIENLILSGEDWIIGQYGIYFQDEFRDYSSSEEFIEAIEVLSQSENIEIIYLSETNEFSRTTESGDVQQFSQVFTAPESQYNNLVIFPIGYSPDYDGTTQWKAKAVLALDNVQINAAAPVETNSCEIMFLGYEDPVYVVQDGVLLQLNVGDIVNLSEISFATPQQIATLEAGIIVSSIGSGMLDIDSVVAEEGVNPEEFESMFDFGSVSILSSNEVSGGHVLVSYECFEACELEGDLNNDGFVATSDLILFNTVFGTFCEEGVGCFGDLNFDGIINVSDLIILLNNLEQSCAEILLEPQYNEEVVVRQLIEETRFDSIDKTFNFTVSIQTPGLKEYIVSFETLFSNFVDVSEVISSYPGVVVRNNKVIIPQTSPGEIIRLYANVVFDDEICAGVFPRQKLPKHFCK